MKNISALLNIIFLGIIMFSGSCLPDEPIEPTPINRELGPYYMGEFLWYVYFDVGTEWVYKGKDERGNTVYDTVMVTSSKIDTVRYSDGVENHWKITRQVFQYRMKASYKDESIVHETPPPGILNFVDTSVTQRMLMKRNNWGEGEIRAVMTDRNGKTDFGDITYEGLQNGIEAGGETYDNVAVFYVTSDVSWDKWLSWPARYYWAKNIGIIKRVQLDEENGNKSWELISYKVNQ
ncbi:MAG: hypothetical protein ACPGLV_18525 [Bacteroidia bacterium]